MSLLVWLPMTKDLTQQGLSDITVSNNGATVDNNGKLGKCYHFDGNDYISISLPSELTTIKNTTICAWIKSTGSVIALGGISNNTNYANAMVTLYTSGWQFSGSSAYKYLSNGLTANDGIWHHVACTIDDTTITTYKDGVKVTSTTLSSLGVTVTDITSANFIEIGCDHPGGDEYLTGYVNDFRIYDHALSPKEIEILSRGLVCHYPLNGGGRGGDNLYTEPYWKYSTTKWGYAAQVGTVKPVLNSDGSVTFTGGGGTNSQCYIHHISNRVAISASTTYTVSCKVTASGSGTFKIYLYQYDSSGAKVGNTITTTHSFVDGETKTISNTITTTSTTASFYAELNMYGSPTTSTMLLHANSLKIEKSDHPTPWIPNPADPAYTAMGYDSTTEYDVSGNGYNGTKNGTLTYSSDTARYNVSTKFAQSPYIQTTLPLPNGDGKHYTFSWWGKYTNYSSHMMWGYANGNRLNLYMFGGNFYWNTGNGENNPFGVSAATYGDNAWHHFVVTGDGTVTKLYIDGEYKANAKAYQPITGTTLIFNGWATSTAYDFNGSLSDFRLYSTTLSTAQVAELYNTAVSVANNGTLLGYEFVEV